eukprot:7370537-Heterocapsa_arctica.AAC.1
MCIPSAQIPILGCVFGKLIKSSRSDCLPAWALPGLPNEATNRGDPGDNCIAHLRPFNCVVKCDSISWCSGHSYFAVKA